MVTTYNMTTVHVVRMIFIVVSFGFAAWVATAISVSRGSPLLGRILLVLFSFSITLGQVAHFSDPLRWNLFFTGITLVFGLWYAVLMTRELRARHRQR